MKLGINWAVELEPVSTVRRAYKKGEATLYYLGVFHVRNVRPVTSFVREQMIEPSVQINSRF